MLILLWNMVPSTHCGFTLSLAAPVFRIPEYLYTEEESDLRQVGGENLRLCRS